MAMVFAIASVAFGSFASVIVTNTAHPEIRLSDGSGPVYPPGSVRTPLPMTADGSGPVYPPGGRSRTLAAIMGQDGGGPV